MVSQRTQCMPVVLAAVVIACGISWFGANASVLHGCYITIENPLFIVRYAAGLHMLLVVLCKPVHALI